MLIKNDKKQNWRFLKRAVYDFFIIIISVSALYFVATALAGSIAPPGSVAPAMMTLENIYNLLGGTYDSAGVTPNNNGNAMQILKCITTKMNGEICS